MLYLSRRWWPTRLAFLLPAFFLQMYSFQSNSLPSRIGYLNLFFFEHENDPIWVKAMMSIAPYQQFDLFQCNQCHSTVITLSINSIFLVHDLYTCLKMCTKYDSNWGIFAWPRAKCPNEWWCPKERRYTVVHQIPERVPHAQQGVVRKQCQAIHSVERRTERNVEIWERWFIRLKTL